MHKNFTFKAFQSNIFLVHCQCFVEYSHRLKYSINPLRVRLQYFLALCKFYSWDHQIMQSSILKYFKLGGDKKLLWFSVRIWTTGFVIDDGWTFLTFSPPTTEKFSVYFQISIFFCQWARWCMASLRIISNHFLACYRLWIRKPDKLLLVVLLKFNMIIMMLMV